MDRDRIAVLPVVGSLVRRGSWLDAECGMMSYGLINAAVGEILMDSSVRGLMVEYDSGGGEANGCFDCSDFIKSASAATGKPVWSHANEIMCSAAYALGSSGQRIWAARTAEVGSIGVIGAHVDVSKADSANGVHWTYIYAGEHKKDGNSHEPLSDGAKSRMQADVDHLYGMFLELGSQNRGVTVEELRDTKADIYRGSLAVDAKLVDEIGTLDEALEAFAEHLETSEAAGSSRLSASQMRVALMKTPAQGNVTGKKADAGKEPGGNGDDGNAEEDGTVTDPENAPEPDPAPAPAPETPEAAAAAAVNARITAETDRCAGLFAVAKQADRLGIAFDAEQAIRNGMSVNDARAKVMSLAPEGDADETSPIAAPKNRAEKGGGPKTMTTEQKRSAWSKAFKRGR